MGLMTDDQTTFMCRVYGLEVPSQKPYNAICE